MTILLTVALLAAIGVIIRLYLQKERVEKLKIQCEVESVRLVKDKMQCEQDMKHLLQGNLQQCQRVKDKWTARWEVEKQQPILKQINDLWEG